MTYQDYIEITLALVNSKYKQNEKKWNVSHIEECALTADACSGGVSWFYKKVLKRKISCHNICLLHDFLYSVGGNELYRHSADLILKYGTREGKFDKTFFGYCRKIWYLIRSEIMYRCVRLFGKKYCIEK